MRALIYPRHYSDEPAVHEPQILRIPASKSHTIRRLILAALGQGVSEISYPLDSLDARSCLGICRSLGAKIEEHYAEDPACPNPPGKDGKRLIRWTVRGMGLGTGATDSGGIYSVATDSGDTSSDDGGGFRVQSAPLDVGNSGTTLFLALAAAALGDTPVTFTGDEQIARRSAAPLLDALAGLGIAVSSAPTTQGGSAQSAGGGCIPITVRGPWKGGRVSISCPTSQYLSALLLAAPLAAPGVITEIEVPLLNEKPYIEMTLGYLKAQDIIYDAAADFSFFRIPGGASYRPINGPVPGDFSSAAFPGGIAAITGGPLTLLGLDREDTQGDKRFFDMLSRMGCTVEWKGSPLGTPGETGLTVSRTGPLLGGEFDLNATPDLLPMMAVVAAYARGDTALVNAAHARIKETDRIAVMAEELGKLGVSTEERPDGLIIHGRGGLCADQRLLFKNNHGAHGLGGGGGLLGGRVDSRGDHRIVMALAVGALGAAGPVEIEAAESAAVTWPGFLEMIGGQKAD